MLKIRPTKNDDIDAALELVMDMAFQGAVDKYDNPRDYQRQMKALKLVRETFSRAGELK